MVMVVAVEPCSSSDSGLSIIQLKRYHTRPPFQFAAAYAAPLRAQGSPPPAARSTPRESAGRSAGRQRGGTGAGRGAYMQLGEARKCGGRARQATYDLYWAGALGLVVDMGSCH